MNIMLVSRHGAHARSACASRWAPGRGHSQFLVEAMTLARRRAGGVAVGLGAAHAVSYVASWRILIQPQAVLLAVRFAVVVGIVFGMYPTREAARSTRSCAEVR
jgi:hypothetical protein